MKRKTLLFIAVALALMAISFRAGMGWQAYRTRPALQRMNGWSDEEYAKYCQLIANTNISPEQWADFSQKLARMEEANWNEIENNALILTAQSLLYLQYLEKENVGTVKELCLDQITRFYAKASQPGYQKDVPKLIDQVPIVLKKIEEAAEKYPALKARLEAAQAETAAEKAPAAQ